jgi:transcriptional regulator with PAS, ATPase and Fis domain
MDLLLRFDWPGNVRELENEMVRAVAMAAGTDTILPEMLSGKIRYLQSGRSEIDEVSFAGPLKEIVRQVERRIIDETLRREHGNRSRTAKALGLSRQGLLNKIAALGINS